MDGQFDDLQAAWVRERQLPVPDAICIATDIAAALDYAQSWLLVPAGGVGSAEGGASGPATHARVATRGKVVA